jgi:hypothetical protein
MPRHDSRRLATPAPFGRFIVEVKIEEDNRLVGFCKHQLGIL